MDLILFTLSFHNAFTIFYPCFVPFLFLVPCIYLGTLWCNFFFQERFIWCQFNTSFLSNSSILHTVLRGKQLNSLSSTRFSCRSRAIQPSTTLSSYFIMLKCIFTHKNYKPPKMFSPPHALYTAQALTQIKFLFNVVLIHAVKIKRL